MDLSLKDEYGFDLIKILRQNNKYKEIPILVLTEDAERETVITEKKIGVQGYLRKPLVKEEMIDKIMSVLHNE